MIQGRQITKSRKTSAVILITLAELAWLAAFGLLFAYRGKVGELGKMRQDLISATNRLAQWEMKLPETADLLKKLESEQAEKTQLADSLDAFKQFLAGTSPEEAARRLRVGAEAEKELARTTEESERLSKELDDQKKVATEVATQLDMAQKKLKELQAKIDLLAENAEELVKKLNEAKVQIVALETLLNTAETEKRHLSQEMRRREAGEYSVRRELTGLPDGDLRRVVFLMDTSTSMRNSPAWVSARNLVRTWLQFLPVEECALVNFNDNASGFPTKGYHRVRESDGTELVAQRDRLLTVFDSAQTGTYTDLLRGLRRAYEYPEPDVMVLFTDGHPHVPFQTDSLFAKNILAEVEKHPGVPILTVALGSYEVEGFAGPRAKTNAPVAFLKELARRSGGNFQGR